MLHGWALTAAIVVLFSRGDGAARDVVHVPCETSGPECGRALQEAIDLAPAGTTITLDAGRTYEGTIVVKPKIGAGPGKRLTITTRGWVDKGEGWDGLVTPADKPRMAVLRGAARANACIDIQNGENAGHVTLAGIAFEATPPRGQGEVVRIGSGEESSAARMARHVTVRQVLIQGDREFGQKRGITANGGDIDLEQVWCEEIFVPGQDAQCVGAWNGGQGVRVRFSYLAAGAENLILGGAPARSAEMLPSDWLIEDVILHKPLRWQQDGRKRQVKNLLEFKQGRNITVRRVLAVNNWRAAQDGTGLLVNYTTNGPCPQCGNLEHVLIEDFVMLNARGGVSFQGYSWQRNSRTDGKLRDVTLRNAYLHLSGSGRTIQIANVMDRHDIRIERSTFINQGGAWLSGSYGRAWSDEATPTRGGAIQGLWIADNVFTSNGKYGVTAPDGHHYGTGLAAFVDEDLRISGNVIGDAPRAHLEAYNEHARGGAPNVSAPRAALLERLPPTACGQWAPGKGADCARLAPVFALLGRLPEP